MTTTDVGTAAVNAALWLREKSDELGVAQMSLAFNEAPVTVLWSATRRLATVSSPGGVVHLSEDELDAERFEVAGIGTMQPSSEGAS